MSTTAAGVPPHAKKGPRWSRQSRAVHRGTEARSPATTDPAKDRRGEDMTHAHSGAAHEEPGHPSRRDAPEGAPAAPEAGTPRPRPTGPRRAQPGLIGPPPPRPCAAVPGPGGRLDRAGGRLDRPCWRAPRLEGRRATTASRSSPVGLRRARAGQSTAPPSRGQINASQSTTASSSSLQSRLRPPTRRLPSETAARPSRGTRSRRPLHRRRPA
jgi:hypothetical protein